MKTKYDIQLKELGEQELAANYDGPRSERSKQQNYNFSKFKPKTREDTISDVNQPNNTIWMTSLLLKGLN